MPQHSAKHTLVFITVVSIVCSLLLSLCDSLLAQRKAANQALDRKRNILKALDMLQPKAKPEQVVALFEAVSPAVLDATGAFVEGDATAINFAEELKKDDPAQRQLPVYLRKEGGHVTGIVIPLVGKGLWSTLYGYLSLQGDANTVLGITFYKHGETPGLGAEIEKDWFQKQFKGKLVWNSDGELVGVAVVKGKAKDLYPTSPEQLSHAVDGISGATLTSRSVGRLLLSNLKLYEPYLSKMREEGQGNG